MDFTFFFVYSFSEVNCQIFILTPSPPEVIIISDFVVVGTVFRTQLQYCFLVSDWKVIRVCFF